MTTSMAMMCMMKLTMWMKLEGAAYYEAGWKFVTAAHRNGVLFATALGVPQMRL